MKEKKYAIAEIFGPTIQGEGMHAGKVVSFLRFAGCNKWSGLEKDKHNSICKFCDTDFKVKERLTASEILQRFKEIGCSIIVVSGGEPLLQLDALLTMTLNREGFRLHIETNGSIKIPFEIAPYINHVCCSPKQSWEETKLTWCDELKLLYPPINEEITIENFAGMPSKTTYLQPVHDENYKENVKETVNKCIKTGANLSLQLHKIIGVK